MLLIPLLACDPATLDLERDWEKPPLDTPSETIADVDGDGYGSSTDCDDTDEDVNPEADEECNGVDDDCDGDVDEDLATTDYVDADGDGYGDDASAFSTCDEPQVRVGGDCDDGDASVSPGAEETCNGVDDDCDGEADDGVTGTTYADEDGDGYGAGQPEESCEGVSNDADCDDADAAVNPGADDLCDGADDDCDGVADDDDDDCDGVVDVPDWGGSGEDGELVVTDTVTLDDAWAVSAVAGRVVTLTEAPGLEAGDEVLVVNLHGTDDAYSHVGEYDFATVVSVAGTSVTLDALTGTYSEAGQAVQVVRVAQYTDVTVEAGGVLTASPWDGATGGVVALRVQDTIAIADGGAVSADALGYAGGAMGSTYNNDASQGESFAGEGDGQHGAAGEGYNETYGWWAANYGGGGAHITGGGGEFAGGATGGDSWDGGGATAPEPGETYGEADLSRLYFGSGGGGVWNDGTANPADGGSGGGLVFVAARDVIVEGAGGITALGGTTAGWASGSWTYGAGGGAGGTVWIVADALSLATEAVDATGGFGNSDQTRIGGDGGAGRVRVDCVSVDGTACVARSLADGVEPDAGYIGAP